MGRFFFFWGGAGLGCWLGYFYTPTLPDTSQFWNYTPTIKGHAPQKGVRNRQYSQKANSHLPGEANWRTQNAGQPSVSQSSASAAHIVLPRTISWCAEAFCSSKESHHALGRSGLVNSPPPPHFFLAPQFLFFNIPDVDEFLSDVQLPIQYAVTLFTSSVNMSSLRWHCWLKGDRNGIRPVIKFSHQQSPKVLLCNIYGGPVLTWSNL